MPGPLTSQCSNILLCTPLTPRATIKVDEYPELRDAPPLPRFITIRAAFPTPIAVASDWATFSNYHAWALSTFIGVAAWLAAARTSTFQTEFPLDDLLLHLYVVPVNRPDQHPANSWFMRCLRLSYLARDIEADKELAQLLGKHEDDFAKVEATFKAMYGARYAGALLIEYHLGVGGLVQPAQRPLYVWHNPARFLEQTTQDAMQDFFDLLQAWICGGIVLKPADPTEKKAVPGRLVQVQKKTRVTWEWTPLDSAQVERLQRSAIPKSRTRMSFAQMAQLYASL
ncbi:hypothetical protein C8T65DRAFT_827817 [Cerioporus squamosus]|nr:hypothetical protein C8T65DRAFT_827817 [Cerioporus squamosus]